MNIENPVIPFFLNLGRTQSILSQRFDRGLNGLGFNEFLILFYLDQADEQKMRRVDLAKKIGMTPSGVTRILVPMEKVHVITNGPIETDARVRFVQITPAGKEKLDDAIERIGLLAEEIIPSSKMKDLEKLSTLLVDIGGRALMS